MTRTSLTFAAIALAFTSLACQQPASDESSAPSPGTTASAEESASSDVEPTAPSVEYEPAYPTDVSEEALTEGDVAQQETPHSHGDGEEHSHDEGEDPSHDDEGHTHGEGETHDDHEH